MESKQNQNELRDWKLNNDIDSTPRPTSASTSKSSTSSIKSNNKSESKQKVPFTLKYQIKYPGLLADLTFDQDKGQFLWATESYQQNLKKRRVTNNSNNGGNSSPKPYDICKVPRPPNAFIIYHRNKSKELAKFKSNGKGDSNDRHPSKTVAEMWKEEPAEIKLQYQREADLALVEHKKKYPFYKYKPKKKDNDDNDDKKEISNEEDDSQVPIEHRKQAAMESAFTVFDLGPSKENNNNNSNSPPHTPHTPHTPHSPTNMTNPQVMTPIWTDYDKQFFDNPINERLNYSPLQLPSPQPQSQSRQQCQCTAHCVNNNNNNNNNNNSNGVASVASTLETLSSEQWNAVSEIFSNVLECMGVFPPSNNPTTPIEATPTSIAQVTPPVPNCISGISITGMENNIITTPTTIVDNMINFDATTCTLDETNYFQITTNDWNEMDIDDMNNIPANYVVPSQSVSNSVNSVPPPTPTSPTDYLSWTHQSIDSQFADPITNVMTTTEQFSQINQQPTNDNLFTTVNDNICSLFNSDFDNGFNFTL
ncbi:hypothetical protein RclHR1_04510016 [Rhizophagus clarus]|uniref:HMG box domain-containing protein n=1 Tax=Rhizophagus clarus TaxID=94130 RepID=A0A2Z6RJ46_9GLOM|nr:hypothetical protein RclHR1_04510016 [Rhizophagus clarus]